MAIWKYLSFFFLLLLLSGTAAIAQKEYFSFDQLSKFKIELFDYYPPTVCALKVLLGSEYEQIKENEDSGGLAGGIPAWEEKATKDSLRGGVIDSHVNYQNEDQRILWVHPNGSIIVGIKRAKNKVVFFTNNTTCKIKPPKIVQEFARETTHGNPNIIWHAPESSKGLSFPAPCEPATISNELKLYLEAKSGQSADLSNLKNLAFTQRPYLVLPKAKTGKTFLQKIPSQQTIDEKLPYLIAGDLVQVVETDFAVKPINDCLGVYYRAVNGIANMGWVNQADLIQIPDDYSPQFDKVFAHIAKPSVKWFPQSISRDNYPGRYYNNDKNFHHRLTVKVQNTKLKVKTEGNNCSGELELKLMGERMAELFKTSSEDRFDLYLFNNAIYLHSLNECVSPGPNFWGIFYPVH